MIFITLYHFRIWIQVTGRQTILAEHDMTNILMCFINRKKSREQPGTRSHHLTVHISTTGTRSSILDKCTVTLHHYLGILGPLSVDVCLAKKALPLNLVIKFLPYNT